MGKTKRKVRTAGAEVAPAPAKVPALASAVAALPEGAEVPASAAKPDTKQPAGAKRIKQKPLVLCARGITYRYRHLMTDLMQLLPHHKTDSKLDTKHDWNAINEVAELKGATSVMFFETRKRSDLYMWLSKCPSGPSARFLCTNVHTMAELKLSGNHLKGSRPVLSFDAAFDEQPQLQVMKELLQQVFVTPQGHQKSKPFFDHVISFTFCDNRIWLRNYQVLVTLDKKKVTEDSTTLIEVGPRVTLQPIKVFAGSFRGKVLFENPEFINPNAVRAYEKRKAAGRYDSRVQRKAARQQHKEENALPEPALTNRRVFAKHVEGGAAAADGDGVGYHDAAASDDASDDGGAGLFWDDADDGGAAAQETLSDDGGADTLEGTSDDDGGAPDDDGQEMSNGSDDAAGPDGSQFLDDAAVDDSSFEEGSSLDEDED